MTTRAAGLTLNERFEIVGGCIEMEAARRRLKDRGVDVSGDRQEYIKETAKRLGLHEDTVRLVMVEGINV